MPAKSHAASDPHAPKTGKSDLSPSGAAAKTPGRARNESYRTREYLTQAEVERLMKAAKDGR